MRFMFSHRDEAEKLLREAVGSPEAAFRHGQWEAIGTLVNKRGRVLIVQRTGWGKSSVYFISTAMMRRRGIGMTLIISPLLALMRNQMQAARALNVRVETINSSNSDDWESIISRIRQDKVDALLISPERLANQNFIDNVLLMIADKIGMLVVDEVHCISEWGHDFRPDYRRIASIIEYMPSNARILGTTATANNRIIEDVSEQMGNLSIQRGSLYRDTLWLDAVRLPNQASRLGWLVQYVPKMPGTGIIYTLTIRDAYKVSEWLNMNGIDARAYHGNLENEERMHLEDLLNENEIKALVATSALGMGYDKPDVGFIVHYQAPGSVVSYYQQVGRAGRGVDKAYGVMLSGDEDDDIHKYFRRSAFPYEDEIETILGVLSNFDGISINEIEYQINLRGGRIQQALKFLSVEKSSPVLKEGSKWYRTSEEYHIDRDRIQRLTGKKEKEWEELQEYIGTEDCRMKYLAMALDDFETDRCGKCSSCLGRHVFTDEVDHNLVIKASRFLRRSEMPFRSRIRIPKDAFPIYGFRSSLPEDLKVSDGRILSQWGDDGFGKMVASDKRKGYFRDDLVEAVAEMYESRWGPQPAPQWVTCVPSLRDPELVRSFSQRLANRLGLQFMDVIRKVRNNRPQKDQENSFNQSKNLDGVFEINKRIPKRPVLLVDDIVDSGWTFTVLGAKLREAGSGEVFTLALASTSIRVN